ncbi:MAG: ATPase [Citromicrobium sp.]|nr:ATPase [Citromicrobium sp.]|tara:strand:- start:8517 stop:10688 length:2172 start_codon:yes stop_codon:yes gene_type:complete
MTTLVERIGTLAVGRVEAVSAEALRISLFNETPQAIALNTGTPSGFPRVNAYILIPNETGAVVAVIKEISIVRAKPIAGQKEEGLVDLPYPARTLAAIPFGTLLREKNDEDGQPQFSLERGVPVLPSVGDPVLLPTATQLRSIVEAKSDDRLVRVGTAPFAGNARVWVHPDKLFGRHLAVLGNTGSGKSCSVAGIIRWALESVLDKKVEPADGEPAPPEPVPPLPPNARFIILDPNGEYSQAFSDGSLPVRRFAVGGKDGANALTVPGWLWNGQEWAAFTAAQPGVQKPILLRALRQLRNAGSSVATAKAQALRRYSGYVRQLEQLYADLPQSVAGFPRNRDFGSLLEGLIGLTESDEEALANYGEDAADLAAAIASIRDPIETVRAQRHWTGQNSSGYSDFQPADLQNVLGALRSLTNAFPVAATHGEISEDAPVRFDVDALPDCIREVAMATGGQALNNVEPLINRIQINLGDSGLKPVIATDGAESLTKWLSAFLGPSEDSPESLAILDLSLIPSDVVHIAVAVIARLVFEALQRHINEKGHALPTVLVLEEAHNFVRRDTDAGANAQATDLCRQAFEKIAREGRKFGLGLVLASQRPSELSPTVLAQCNSFLLHRIVNDVDQNLVRRLVPDALGGLLGELPTLPSQQAILLGWAVPTPVLLKVRDLPKPQCPRSHDPKFWDTWLGNSGAQPDWAAIAASWENSAVDSNQSEDTDGGCQN